MQRECTGPVLLFDGECGLCVRCVASLLRADWRGSLCVAPLQGAHGQRLLEQRGLPTRDFDSIVLVPAWELRADVPLLFRTDALLATAGLVGGRWRCLTALRVVPTAVRDAAYRLVAKTRGCLFNRGSLEDIARHPLWRRRLLS